MSNNLNNLNPKRYTNNQNMNFPIWEKVYLESKDNANIDFFENFKAIPIRNQIFIFPSSMNKENKFYFIFDLENEILKQEEMSFHCFYPIFNQISTIYLFRYDDSYTSDFRYSLVEFNIESREWLEVPMSGVSPKKRSDDFTSFFHNNKIYFFGGIQNFQGDNSTSLIYSFCTLTNEWKIENYSGDFPLNRCGMNGIMLSTDKFLFFGGKYIENSLSGPSISSSSFTTSINKFSTEVECDDFYEIEFILSSNALSQIQTQLQFTRKQISKLIDDVKFCNFSLSMCRDKDYMIYVYNKNCFYLLDLQNSEISMLKPLLFNPECVKDSFLTFYNNNLYIIGKCKYYDDCFIFKTHQENLISKWNCLKENSYEMFLNNKECSDIIVNTGDKNREICVNKKIMYNFSFPLKTIIMNLSQKSNKFSFDDVSFIGVYNTLKFIYSNFTDNISIYDIEIVQEMIDIIIRYRAKSLLMIVLSKMKTTSENAIQLYEIANKFNLKDFKQNTYNFIAQNLPYMFSKERNFISESIELKRILYDNYFCQHLVTVQVNCLGFDIQNLSQTNITNEKIEGLKEICNNNKMQFCIFCKKVV
jgi:hypothetical protein